MTVISHTALAPRPRLAEPVSVSCEPVRLAEPHGVGATYWFDAEPEGLPYPVTIRFFARRIGARTRRGTAEERTQYERIDRVIPGCGRVSVTTRFEGVTSGEWEIFAAPANNPREPGIPAGWANTRPLRLPRASTVAETSFAPVVNVLAPGVRFGAWPALVLFGVGIALTMQVWLASRAGLGVTSTLGLSIAASLVGLVGAKVWYLVLHRQRPTSLFDALSAGMCIQGFIVSAVATLAVGRALLGWQLGVLLDATAPGLLLAMALGRVGCLLAGCCAGRGTRSRFGIWSSDRRIGMRRVPVQLLESALAAALAAAALVAELLGPVHPAGTTMVVAVAAYTGLRQLLFPLRAQGRQTAHGRALTMAVASVAVVIPLLIAAAGPSVG